MSENTEGNERQVPTVGEEVSHQTGEMRVHLWFCWSWNHGCQLLVLTQTHRDVHMLPSGSTWRPALGP